MDKLLHTCKHWDEITHPCSNFKGCSIKHLFIKGDPVHRIKSICVLWDSWFSMIKLILLVLQTNYDGLLWWPISRLLMQWLIVLTSHHQSDYWSYSVNGSLPSINKLSAACTITATRWYILDPTRKTLKFIPKTSLVFFCRVFDRYFVWKVCGRKVTKPPFTMWWNFLSQCCRIFI